MRFYSPDYAAPEWISEGEVGLHMDVYVLGVLLYQLLTGVLPFEQEQDQSELTTWVMRGKPSVLGLNRFS